MPRRAGTYGAEARSPIYSQLDSRVLRHVEHGGLAEAKYSSKHYRPNSRGKRVRLHARMAVEIRNRRVLQHVELGAVVPERVLLP